MLVMKKGGTAATCFKHTLPMESVDEVAEGETCGNNPTKSLGHWESGLGCMVWESVEAGLVDLAKDPVTGNYFPCVVHPQRHSSTPVSKSGHSPSSSKFLGSAEPPKTEVKQNSSTSGVYTRWKKCARQSPACHNQAVQMGQWKGNGRESLQLLGGMIILLRKVGKPWKDIGTH
jgi:hypothetical protein